MRLVASSAAREALAGSKDRQQGSVLRLQTVMAFIIHPVLPSATGTAALPTRYQHGWITCVPAATEAPANSRHTRVGWNMVTKKKKKKE